MGRFDQLTQIPQKPQQKPSPAHKPANPQTGMPASRQTRKPVNGQTDKPESGLTGKPENRLDGKPANPQTGIFPSEQVEKYTTRLEPSLIKKIKHYALEHDMKDYEVIQTAVKKLLMEEK